MSASKSILAEKKTITPLWIVALFVTFTETVLGIAVFNTTGNIQIALTVFVLAFPLIIFSSFFAILWFKPYVFYPPTEFGKNTKVIDFVEAMQRRPELNKPNKDNLLLQEQAQKQKTENNETQNEESLAIQAEENLIIEEKEYEISMTAMAQIARQTHDLDKLSEAYNNLQSKEKDEIKKLENEVLYLFLRHELGETSELDKLKNLATREETSSAAYSAIGAIYAANNDVDEAIKYYELSLTHSKDEITKTKRVIAISNVFYKVGRKEDAYSYIQEAISKTEETDSLTSLYKTLASFYKREGKKELATLALEKALETQPNNTDLLFDLAFIYAELERLNLSQLYYESVLRIVPDNAQALNNFGVGYDRLDLPIYCVNSYIKAIELENSLASANMAYRLINAGFVKEASEILDKFKVLENAHPNIASAIVEISKQQKLEEEKWNDIKNNALQEQQHYRNYAKSYYKKMERAVDVSGHWISDTKGRVLISQTDNNFEFIFTEDFPFNKFNGTITNLAAKITKFERDFEAEDLTFVKKGTGYAYISESNDEIDIVLPNDKEELLLKFRRLQELKTEEKSINSDLPK